MPFVSPQPGIPRATAPWRPRRTKTASRMGSTIQRSIHTTTSSLGYVNFREDVDKGGLDPDLTEKFG
eukprot:scaffold24824_cov48-Attheya_sp.AAC.1